MALVMRLNGCLLVKGGMPFLPKLSAFPGARHFLWDYITKEVITGGRSVLLTSHSMEECEVLCGRIAIMAAGKLKCIGTPQHLKARFAEGYSLELRLEDGQDPAVPQEVITPPNFLPVYV